jgi:putative cardiolipin synthase
VEDELYLFSPYFVPGKVGTEALAELSRNGIRVRVVTNSLASTDVAVVHSGYAKYRKKLLRAGVELYEMKPRARTDAVEHRRRGGGYGLSGSSRTSLHSKAFIFDREHIFIGSLNLDPRSVVENTEIGVVLTAPREADRVAGEVDKALRRVAYRLSLETDEQGGEHILWHDEDPETQSVYSTDPHSSVWQRFIVGAMGLLPVESQL